MKKRICFLVLIITTGCSTLDTTVTETRTDGWTETTTIHIVTFMDGKNNLSNFRTTSTEKTKGVTIGAMSQESTSEAVQAIAHGVAAGVLKSVKP